MTDFGIIGQPYWDDAPAYILGGGPSLVGFDFNRLEGLGYLVGVNQSMFDAPCDCGISVDHKFVINRQVELGEFAKRKPLYLCVGNDWRKALPEIVGAIYLQSVKSPGLSFACDHLHKGATSGYAALGLAVLKRTRTIFLLGFDYGVDGSQHHYHEKYSWYHKASDQSWKVWAQKYEPAARDCINMGVEVFNASLNSSLTCFKKISLEQISSVAA